MRLETFTGPSIPELFAQVRDEIGADAVLLSLRRPDPGKSDFQMVAADPRAVERWKAKGTTGSAKNLKSPEPRARPALSLDTAPSTGRPFVLAVVGPTGSGKTTTLAKLANHASAFSGKRVGFVSLDSYRVGAAEQLGAYAGLFRIPLEVVYESRELPRALSRLGDCRVLLVDTPGRGPREQEDREAVRASLRKLRPDEVHLTLPAGIADAAAREIITGARADGVTHLLPTKLDEFSGNDTVSSLAEELGFPVRWLADGQRVPRDLRMLDPGSRRPVVYGRTFQTAGV